MPRGRKAKATEEKQADVIAEEVKEEAVADAETTEKIKEEAAKVQTEETVQTEEVKKTPAKRGRKPASEKTETKAKTPAKRGRKPASEKAEAKEAASSKEVEANVVLQFEFGEFVSNDLVKKCEEAYKAENKAKIKSIDIYVKPSERKAYYVVNDKSAGYVDLES